MASTVIKRLIRPIVQSRHPNNEKNRQPHTFQIPLQSSITICRKLDKCEANGDLISLEHEVLLNDDGMLV